MKLFSFLVLLCSFVSSNTQCQVIQNFKNRLDSLISYKQKTYKVIHKQKDLCFSFEVPKYMLESRDGELPIEFTNYYNFIKLKDSFGNILLDFNLPTVDGDIEKLYSKSSSSCEFDDTRFLELIVNLKTWKIGSVWMIQTPYLKIQPYLIEGIKHIYNTYCILTIIKKSGQNKYSQLGYIRCDFHYGVSLEIRVYFPSITRYNFMILKRIAKSIKLHDIIFSKKIPYLYKIESKDLTMLM